MHVKHVRLGVPSAALLVCLLLSMMPFASARAAVPPSISLTALGTAYTQNFDSLANTGTTASATPDGWTFSESGTNANTTYGVGTGSSNSGNTYSFGVAGVNPVTDRALGGLRSGSLIPTFGASFTNNTTRTITSLDIAYTGEEWRYGYAGVRPDRLDFQYSLDATSLSSGTWVDVEALDFTTPNIAGAVTVTDGNAPANRTSLSSSISGLSLADGATIWIRWNDFDATGSDDGLAVDDFSLIPHAASGLSINSVSKAEGDSGTTAFTFTISLSDPAAADVTFNVATVPGTATSPEDFTALPSTPLTIAAGKTSTTVDVLVNGDTTPESNETFTVNVSDVVGSPVVNGQGTGTIINDDLSKIHDVQGSGATSPIVGSTVLVEGVVTGSYQGASQLKGFFLQEEDVDADADPATSEGIFIFCDTCTTSVAEGQIVRASGDVSEFKGLTEISATAAGSVVVVDTSDNLSKVTPATIDLPIVGDVNAYYEARESMLVKYADTLTVSEYFQLPQFGQITLYEGARPHQFTDGSAPSVTGYASHLAALATRQVILDDDNNGNDAYLSMPATKQFIFYPQANGGFSVGTQGTDFFRGGDTVSNLTGILHWSWAGSGDNTWRIRPVAAHPVTFTPANTRPATPPEVGGTIKAVGMNMLNYFKTIDTSASSSAGDCGPNKDQDCRGADSDAELARQRERASIVICTLNADVYGLMEMENTTGVDAIGDLLSAVNARCGGAKPFAAVDTGGTLGTDAIRVNIIYRTGTLAPVGAALVDTNSIHSRPPTAQTFQVVDAANPAYGAKFTLIANHSKSKGCSASATGADADQNDGQSCYADRRAKQAARLLTWINSTVVPAAGTPDVLMVGDFNSYAKETATTTITSGGFTDLASDKLGADSYSYLFDSQLGHLDYAFASTSLKAKVTGMNNWHINADESELFDYNDTVKDVGEAAYDVKPDGSGLTNPRTLWEPNTPYRASDHDPVLVGLNLASADLAVTKSASPIPVNPGENVTYTITVTNSGPTSADKVIVTDAVPANATFVSASTLTSAGWTVTAQPAAGGTGNIVFEKASVAASESATLQVVVKIDAGAATGSQMTSTVNVTSTTADPNTANNTFTLKHNVGIVAATVSLAGLNYFYDGSAKSATVTTSPAGLAVSVTYNGSTTLPVNAGTYAVVATVTEPSYSGTASGTLTIAKGGTGATLRLSSSVVSAGQPVTLTTHIIVVGIGVPTGTVTFMDGTTTLGTATVSNGIATFTTSSLPVGAHTLTASYAGDSNFNGSTTGTQTLQVVNLHFFLPIIGR